MEYLCRYFEGSSIELTAICERDCELQLRVFDHSRQDNYDRVISIKAGRPRSFTLPLSTFQAADQSQIPLKNGHIITGLGLLVKGATADPGLRIVSYRILRRDR